MTKSKKLITDYKRNERVLISPYELLGLHARIEYLEGELEIERENNKTLSEVVDWAVK